MATTVKVLGQLAPSATTNTDLYTAPSATSAVISTLTICNRSDTVSTFNIAVRPGGAAIENKHYIAFQVAVPGRDTTTLTLGITLATTDVITVYASSANLSFNAFGSELT